MTKVKKILVIISVCFCTAVILPLLTPDMASVYSVQAASKVKINKKSATVTKGEKVQLKISGTTKKVTWKSADKKVATVSSKGLVKGVKQGTTTVTATVEKKTFTCKITVKAAKTTEMSVWIPQTGAKYHRNSNCSNMKNPSKVKKSVAENWGYTPCKKCY